jgi:hypothetical protein
MRLGLIGMGRIGAFHADTLTSLGAVEAGWIAEACTLSMHEHRPVRMTEVRTA